MSGPRRTPTSPGRDTQEDARVRTAVVHADPPPLAAFTPAERRLIRRLDNPYKVQAWLNLLPYNREPDGPTVRSFRGVVCDRTAHCLEAVLAAATILEQHGYPPLLLDLDSKDGLGHVMLLFREGAKYGSIARSRDPGLHGRKPHYRNFRTLAQSYAAPYVDATGRVTAYGLLDLRTLPRQDWRLSPRNVFHVETALIRNRHTPLRMSETAYRYWKGRFERFKAQHPDSRPDYFPSRRHWLWP